MQLSAGPSALLRVPLVWLSILLLPIATAQMPYNPTRILHNGTTLYVFQPSSGSSSQFELGSIDISSKVASSDIPYTALYPTLPFLDGNTLRPFTPVLDNGGNMTVYTGDCSKGASGAEIWNFTPESSGKSGNGTWKQQDINFNQDNEHVDTIGANYLSAGMAFSAVVDGDASDTGAYFFGGMCSSPGQASDWQSSANYSNLMVTLEPGKENPRSLTYQLDVSSSYGPPIPEAGFTLTGLSPSFSNRSDGTQTQQQDFVLVGGHTRTAFINMSQVALFSLPQQGWTFVPVEQPDTGRTDLAIRTDVSEVEPRSGHSAVLTPDGQRIIIFGGWVGDIDTPALPQLAVLNVGEGYGGQDSWQWTVPTTSGEGLSGNSGVYGHGAAMLPGGVMMIMGGYSIAAPASRWRRASTVANTKTLFFNTTSNTFISEYSLPADAAPSGPTDSGGPLASTGQKAGLGVGLGIGMAAVLTLLVFYILFTRRAKKQREAREEQLQSLSMDAHRYNLESISPGVDGRGGRDEYFDDPNDSYFYPSLGHQQKSGWRQTSGQDAERTGLLVEIPSPTRGLRRSLSGRAQHHMSRYDERRATGAGNIHPIDEEEEHEEEHELDITDDRAPLNGHSEMSERSTKEGASIFDSAPVLEPFVDMDNSHQRGATQSAPTSPMREENRNGLGPSDWQLAIGALLPRRSSPNSKGRSSPEHSERTSSNLSEQSHRSNLSSNSTNGSIQRTASIRSTAMMKNAHQANPFKTPNGSPTSKHPNRESGAGWESPDARTQSLSSIRSGLPSTAEERDSFTTARTSFMQLQAEGEALLGGAPSQVRPGTASTSTGSNPRTYQDTEPSMSRAGTLTAATSVTERSTSRPRRKSWLGSVRRALGRATDTSDGRTRSLNTSTPQLERYTDSPISPARTEAEDNRKSFPAAAPPRRAASDAAFWRSRRGRQDWLDEELDENDPQARWRRTSGDDWGAPEDVALAERERQRREWRERSTLINLGDDELPTPKTPIHPRDLGDPNRPHTPADEEDWDVEAAVERRVVQVMFTVPKSKLRVVNADVDRSSILSLPRENSDDSIRGSPDANGTPNRVKDLVGRFEQQNSPRPSPRMSPSPSIRSLKVRSQGSSPSLAAKRSSPNLPKGKARLASEDITTGDRS
jgi:hypothetical protein